MNTSPPLSLSLPLPMPPTRAAVRSRSGDAGATPPAPNGPSGEGWHGHPLFSVDNLYRAYRQCRRRKRRTHNALLFERHLEANLLDLHQELNSGTYSPGRSIAFLVNRPKRREVFAASFRDRVVHHVLVSHRVWLQVGRRWRDASAGPEHRAGIVWVVETGGRSGAIAERATQWRWQPDPCPCPPPVSLAVPALNSTLAPNR